MSMFKHGNRFFRGDRVQRNDSERKGRVTDSAGTAPGEVEVDWEDGNTTTEKADDLKPA